MKLTLSISEDKKIIWKKVLMISWLVVLTGVFTTILIEGSGKGVIVPFRMILIYFMYFVSIFPFLISKIIFVFRHLDFKIFNIQATCVPNSKRKIICSRIALVTLLFIFTFIFLHMLFFEYDFCHMYLVTFIFAVIIQLLLYGSILALFLPKLISMFRFKNR